jgi:hypothetical protein
MRETNNPYHSMYTFKRNFVGCTQTNISLRGFSVVRLGSTKRGAAAPRVAARMAVLACVYTLRASNPLENFIFGTHIHERASHVKACGVPSPVEFLRSERSYHGTLLFLGGGERGVQGERGVHIFVTACCVTPATSVVIPPGVRRRAAAVPRGPQRAALVRVELRTILIKYAFKISIQFWSRRDNSVVPLA